MSTMEQYHGMPKYLRRMIASYLSNRILWYDTEAGPRTYKVTGGVPQGSVLGPTLWNVMYDGILRLRLPAGASLIAFADDVAVLVVAKQLETVENIFHEAMGIIQHWMTSVGLSLAGHKTEAVLFTGRKKREDVTIHVGSNVIRTQPSLRYLGMLMDQRLSFKDNIVAISDKATAYSGILARLMPNIGGPRQSRRLLLSSVSTSVLLYGAPVWAGSLKVQAYRKVIASSYRLGAVRTACAYRTISDDAVCVIAGMLPVDILAAERQRLYLRKGAHAPGNNNSEVMRRGEREVSLEQWQERWDLSPKGRWTHLLIPNIRDWVARIHGEVNYHLTQFLSGHGCFKAYLKRMHLIASAECPSCRGVEETPSHVMVDCPRFEVPRQELEAEMGETLQTPEGLVRSMLQSRNNWAAARRFVVTVMNELQRIDNERKRSTVE